MSYGGNKIMAWQAKERSVSWRKHQINIISDKQQEKWQYQRHEKASEK